MKTKPRAYQETAKNLAIQALTESNGFALFMDMGTGKTLTSLYIAESLGYDRVLIIAPKAMLLPTEWPAQIKRHSDYNYITYSAQSSKTQKYKNAFAQAIAGEKVCFVVNLETFSYGMPKRKGQKNTNAVWDFIEEFCKPGRTLVIVDESSKIKNPDASRTETLISYFRGSQYRKLILSGTPFSQTPFEVWSQMEFLIPGFWGGSTYHVFQKTWGTPKIEYLPRGRQIVVYYCTEDGEKHILSKIKNHCFQIKKEECADLPPKVFQIRRFELSPSEEDHYRDMEKNFTVMLDSGDELNVFTAEHRFTAFQRLRTLTGGMIGGKLVVSKPAKISALEDALQEMPGKVAIFCAYLDEIKLIQHFIPNTVAYTGEMRDEELIRSRERFETDPTIKVMIISTKKGSFGLNLQFCHNAIYYSRPVSIQEYLQSQDRFHRIGQENRCLYIDLVAENTIDETLIRAQAKKVDILHLFQTALGRQQLAALMKEGESDD